MNATRAFACNLIVLRSNRSVTDCRYGCARHYNCRSPVLEGELVDPIGRLLGMPMIEAWRAQQALSRAHH